jgi:hypothetical protein
MILAVDLTDVNEHKQAVNFHTMFFNALCQAVVFSDTSLKITGFSTSEANYFQPQADLQKGSFVRNLFTKEAAKVILNQGIKMVARTGYWKEQVKLNSGNGDKTVSLEIIHLLNAKGTLKGFAFLFERNLDVSVATERL